MIRLFVICALLSGCSSVYLHQPERDDAVASYLAQQCESRPGRFVAIECVKEQADAFMPLCRTVEVTC